MAPVGSGLALTGASSRNLEDDLPAGEQGLGETCAGASKAFDPETSLRPRPARCPTTAIRCRLAVDDTHACGHCGHPAWCDPSGRPRSLLRRLRRRHRGSDGGSVRDPVVGDVHPFRPAKVVRHCLAGALRRASCDCVEHRFVTVL